MSSTDNPRLTWGLAFLAVALFSPLFVIGGFGAFDFWWWMSSTAVLLLVLYAGLDAGWRRSLVDDLGAGLAFKLGLGVASAAVLYGVFYVGNLASRWMFDFAAPGIDAVYGFKSGAGLLRVGLLIGLIIGPCEELFWRGFLQRRLAARHGPWVGLGLATAFYTGIHLSSLNPMLILAALLCGLFWGVLYLRYRSMLLNVVSHVLWDLAIFLFFPLG